MLTFQDIYTEAQAQAQDTSAASAIVIKRGANQGMHKFMAVLNRDWIDQERTFDVKANQQYYQNPEDAIRIKSVVVTVGSVAYPLDEIATDDDWHALNMRTQTNSFPRFYFVKGSDQYGIWPTPSALLTGGGLLTFEGRARDMSQDDYTTGTVTMVNGSAAVVGSSTVFTANMVGRKLQLTDGSPDGIAYTIAAFTDSTHITLENAYGGLGGAGKTYRIGEVPNIPDEFHEALIDYAMYRYYRRRRDWTIAKDMKSTFDEALVLCEQNYSSKSSSQYYRPPHISNGYNYLKRDQTVN